MSLTLSAWTDSNIDNQQVEQNIHGWFAAIKADDITKAGSYMAPNFVSVHTDGIVLDKAAELTLIQNLQMMSYQLSDFQLSDNGDVIVATFKDQAIEKVDKKLINHKPALRMAVSQKQNNQ